MSYTYKDIQLSFDHPPFDKRVSSEVKDREWTRLNRNGAPIFMDAYLRAWGVKKDPKNESLYFPFQKEVENVYMYFKGDKMSLRWLDMKLFGYIVLDYFIKLENFNRYLEQKNTINKKIQDLWISFPREKIQSLADHGLIDLMAETQNLLTQSWFTEPISGFVSEMASEYTEWWLDKKSVKPDLKKEYTHQLFAYDKISATIERQLKIKESIDRCKADEKEIAIRRFVAEYAYAKADFAGEIPYTAEDVIKDYESAGRLQVSTLEYAKKKEDILNMFSATDQEKQIFMLFGYCTFSRDERRAYQQRLFTLIDWIITELAERYKIERAHLKYSKTEELEIDNLKNEAYKNLLIKRYNDGIISFWRERENYTEVVGIEADAVLQEIDREENQDKNNRNSSSSLVGLATFTGKVSGKAKVILDAKGKEPEGPFILVTGMTSPEFIHLMEKCQAIVTDEGGITCHAAILSRELKKPCIVGTKNATKLIRDGDMLEVDADNGIITILI